MSRYNIYMMKIELDGKLRNFPPKPVNPITADSEDKKTGKMLTKLN